MKIKGIILKYLTKHCYIRSLGGDIIIASSARLRNVKVYVYPGATLNIGNDCILDNVIISVMKGKVVIGNYSQIIGKKYEPTQIIIDNGKFEVADHSKICGKRVWVRFGGRLSVGKYTNVNDGSEIRCDEGVSIGDYNQISYNVRIWDTNTHSILPPNERRRIAEEKFPYFGFEETRPKTAPVTIGNDCWIGENVTILKGSQVGDGSIIGFGTLISGELIPDNTTAVCHRDLSIIKR